MAEKDTKNKQKELIEATPEEVTKLEEQSEPVEKKQEETPSKTMSWIPKTKLGKLVREGKEKDFDLILKSGKKVMEAEIADSLLNLESDLLSIGQAKGKFGGGKRRAWRQTQKKTMEGNVLTFSCMAVVGDRNGHVGLGSGRAKETLPSREKAIRNAKLNVMHVQRGFESPEYEKDTSDPHTVPFKVQGKCGSVRITLMPAPRGTGLVIGDEGKKILRLAGIKDVYTRSFGQAGTTFNYAQALMDALSKTTKMRKTQ